MGGGAGISWAIVRVNRKCRKKRALKRVLQEVDIQPPRSTACYAIHILQSCLTAYSDGTGEVSGSKFEVKIAN
jgi:hypothetical protein